jgi:signal transduction histidine kinase
MFKTLKPRDEIEGSGMGLAIIKKLIERQGGKIWVDSQAGKRGTNFIFDWRAE